MDFSQHFKHNKLIILRGYLLLIILIFINLISINHFLRLDLTEDKKYQISQSSEKVVNSVDDILTIKVYVSDKLPPNLNTTLQYVKDILSEYEAVSNGNLKVSYLDPSKNTDTLQESGEIGIPQVQMEVLEKDKYQVQNGYFGLAIFYAGKNEIIPIIQNISSLEYDITSKIKKLSGQQTKTVGFLEGHEEYSQNNSYKYLSQELAKTYNLKVINLSEPQIESDTIIIGGPKKDFTPEELAKIENYIKNGGKVIFMIDGLNIDGSLNASPIDLTNINNYLRTYGLSVNNDIIYDKYHENASFTQGYMSFFLPYPFFIKVIEENFDKENIIVNSLSSVVMPWASSINSESKENIKLTSLMQSSKYSQTQQGTFDLNPQQEFTLTSPNQSILASLVQNTPNIKNKFDFIVISDSDFVSDSFIQQYPQNLAFVQNAVDYLTLDPDLINIRSKNIEDSPLKPISENFYLPIKAFAIFTGPIILIIYGLIRHRRRKLLKNI